MVLHLDEQKEEVQEFKKILDFLDNLNFTFFPRQSTSSLINKIPRLHVILKLLKSFL